jgi:hypothetical protein
MDLYAPLHDIAGTMHRRICPLYSFDSGGTIHVVGSAVPFSSGGISFLVTAGHVCDDSRRNKLALFTWDDDGPLVLKNAHLMWESKIDHPDPDLALIALTEAEAARLAKAYQFCRPEMTATVKPKAPHIHYVVTGYPSVRNRVKRWLPESPPAMATHLITGDIHVAGLRFPRKNDESHFAVSFLGANIRRLDGTPFRMPKPQGMSGGGVWQVHVEPGTKLTSSPLLVGIGIEFYKSHQTFVATRIQLAIPLVHDLMSLLSGVQPRDVVRGE